MVTFMEIVDIHLRLLVLELNTFVAIRFLGNGPAFGESCCFHRREKIVLIFKLVKIGLGFPTLLDVPVELLWNSQREKYRS